MNFIDNIKAIDNIELYAILVLTIFTIWFIYSTVRYYIAQKRIVKHLHRFAKEGEANSQYELAKRYLDGKTVKKSCHNAAFFSQKASFSGNEDAKLFLEDIKKKKCSKINRVL